jgi:hypothetical protein
LAQPFARGRFTGAIGAGHLYHLRGFDAARSLFWFGTSSFLVAAADLPYVGDWSWSNDDIVLYDDPDHVGWYDAYNTRTGNYVHVQYDGPLE